MPAATVSFVASSTRMNAPVARFTSYGSTISGAGEAQPHRADVVQRHLGRVARLERVHVDDAVDALDDGAHGAGRVLDAEARTRQQRPLAHPADGRLERPRGHGLIVGIDEHVAARHVDLVLEPDRDGHARRRLVDRAVGRVDRRDAGAQAGRQHEHVVAGAPHAAGDLAGVAAVVVVLVGHRPDHPLDGEAAVGEIAVARRARSPRGARAASRPATTASARTDRRRCRRGGRRSGSPPRP